MENNCDIKLTVRKYLEKVTMLNSGDIQDDTLIFDQGLLDSMGLLFLVDFLRENFGVEALDDELVNENFESINSISNFVSKKRILSNSVSL